MEIKKAQIKYFCKYGFRSVHNEGEKHIKVLPYLSVVEAVEGSYDITLGNGETYQTGEGGFFIAPAGIQQTIVHHVNPKSKKMSARWIFVDVEIDDVYKIDAVCTFPTVIRGENGALLNDIFEHLFETDDVWENYGDVYRILGLLSKTAIPIKKAPHKEIQAAVSYIKNNYTEPITIARLASMVNMSESNFYAVFKKVLGDSPISYLNHYRLSLAAVQLIASDKTVAEIGSSVGINDALYFSKLFKKTYGMSPKEYRRVYRKE